MRELNLRNIFKRMLPGYLYSLAYLEALNIGVKIYNVFYVSLINWGWLISYNCFSLDDRQIRLRFKQGYLRALA